MPCFFFNEVANFQEHLFYRKPLVAASVGNFGVKTNPLVTFLSQSKKFDNFSRCVE